MLAYVALGVIVHYRVSDWKRLFLVGAIYGWLAEGAVVTTMYGTTMGIWATISYTGLAWHALMTGLLGWLFLVQGVRGEVAFKRFIKMVFYCGLFWGIWALNWGYEEPGWDLTNGAFVFHTWVYALPLPIAYWLLSKLSFAPFVLSRFEWKIIGFCFGGLYLMWNFTTAIFPFSLALPLLLWLTLSALKRSQNNADTFSFGELWGDGPFQIWRGISLLLIPLVASLTYVFLHEIFGALHTNWLVFLVQMPLGYALYVYVLWKCFRTPHSFFKKTQNDLKPDLNEN